MVLAVFAIVTAIFAMKASGKQSAEVATLDRQAQDQRELTRQQGELLTVQSGQLELQREQLTEQRALNEKQTALLELQSEELIASLDQRERDSAERHRAQAVRVFMWQERFDIDPDVIDEDTLSAGSALPSPVIVAHVRNASDHPIYDLRFSWHRGTAPYRHGEAMRPVMPRDDAYAKCGSSKLRGHDTSSA